MSGIAAILYRNGRSASATDMQRIGRALQAYGPERQTSKVLGPVGFAYTHLTNTPEARGDAQPRTGGDGRFTMLFDGRLDNREDIATALNLDRDRLMLMSDSALAMASWERWGTDCPAHWVGEFALIVWDENEGVLTALRDHFGARTLHYAADADRVILASAPKGIHALGDLPREVDPQKVADALCQLYHDGERSFFKGVRRVPVAGILQVGGGDVSLRKYYRLRDAVKPVRYRTDEEYVEAGLEQLDTAVRALMRSGQAIGSFMSGGLDSSSMSVLAADHLAKRNKKLISYTSVPEAGWDRRDVKGLFGDEAPYVREIGAMVPNIEINLVDGEGLGHYHRQEELLLHLEMPVRNALNLQWTHAILEQARARGIGVMLQGTFGNATMTHFGDGVFAEHLRAGRLGTLYSELAAISTTPRQFLHRMMHNLVYPLSPQWLWDAKEKMRGRDPAAEAWKKSAAIQSAFAAEMDISARAAAAGYTTDVSKPGYTRPAWYNMIENWITDTGDINQGLRAMYGIEIRDPFADRRVVEWSFGVPESQFQRGGVNRWLIRRMMAGKLPASVVDNKKFGHQTGDWHLRLSRDLPQIRKDLDALKHNPETARMIDLERLCRLVDDWPARSLTDPKDERLVQIHIGLPMVMQIARFVQRESGAN